MKRKSVLSAAVSGILSMAIAMSMTSCASGTTTSSGAASGTASGSDKIPTIKMVTICATVPADTAQVSEAISKITREKIGANVELVPVEIGNWAQRMSLLLTGDDAVDVYSAGGWSSLASVVSNGQALALDDYLKPYAADMEKALTKDVFNAGKINGKIYGVARYLDFASGTIYNFRKDVADKYGVKNGDAMSLSKLTDLFKKIKADYPTTALAGSTSIGLSVGQLFDSRVDYLGDTNMLGVIADMKTGDKVANYYESPLYSEAVSYFKQWKQMGVYMADPLNNTEQPTDYLASGKCLGYFGNHFAAELSGIYASNTFGVPMVAVSVLDSVAQNPGMYYCVSPSSKSPEKATAFLNLMATNADIENLLCNGVKDVHYTVDSDGVAHYMQGKNASSTGWSVGFSWTQLNSPLSHPFEYPKTYYEVMIRSNNEAAKSKAFGFQFDAKNVSNEITACTNVVSQYRPAIETGSVENLDTAVAQFQKALKDAGIDKIIAEKQSQLDKFIASNK